MKIKTLTRSIVFLAVSAVLAGAGLTQAQGVEIDEARGAEELRAEMRDAAAGDVDTTNTALLFNNVTRINSYVVCTAYDGNGNVLGTKRAYVPKRGVKYLRASDFSNGADFVGSAVCTSRERMAASAVLLAPGAITQLDVIQPDAWDLTRIRFALIATY